jgi:uncharacterized protein (DUF488 family)
MSRSYKRGAWRLQLVLPHGGACNPAAARYDENMTIHTVGHSTRGADDFRELLQNHRIGRLVDVRQYPGSRRFPHFASPALAESLASVGIDYLHEVDLGGRRRPQPDSMNLYWRNASFRAYADYMAGERFEVALERLVSAAADRLTAIMCAEAVPWRCHRWLISDALVARCLSVVHIINSADGKPHTLTSSARVAPRGTLTYPAPLFAIDDQ